MKLSLKHFVVISEEFLSDMDIKVSRIKHFVDTVVWQTYWYLVVFSRLLIRFSWDMI